MARTESLNLIANCLGPKNVLETKPQVIRVQFDGSKKLEPRSPCREVGTNICLPAQNRDVTAQCIFTRDQTQEMYPRLLMQANTAIGSLTHNITEKTVTIAKDTEKEYTVTVTTQESIIYQALFLNHGRVISGKVLYNTLYPEGKEMQTLRTVVGRLRKKLLPLDSGEVLIQTRGGEGYVSRNGSVTIGEAPVAQSTERESDRFTITTAAGVIVYDSLEGKILSSCYDSQGEVFAPKEKLVWDILLAQQGSWITAEELMERFDFSSKALGLTIMKIRKKIGQQSQKFLPKTEKKLPEVIENRARVGYRMSVAE